MANSRYPTGGVIGANTAEPTPVDPPSGIEAKQFQLGQVEFGADNTRWAYGVASGSVATGTCTYNATTFAITDAAGNYTADVALADGQEGWVRITAGANP